MHAMICIKKDGIDADDIDSPGQRQDLVKNIIANTITANLVERGHSDESDLKGDEYDKDIQMLEELDFDFSPSKDYFHNAHIICNGSQATEEVTLDENDPRRLPFDESLNYRRTIKTTMTGEILEDVFEDPRVQTQYRRLQLANQMHECCFTCFKYCQTNKKVCRFNFPWSRQTSDSSNAVIFKDRDKKSRIRIRAFPPRNNANLNVTAVDPLLVIAHGGNHDLQYVDNAFGAAEYASSYAGKYEEPDSKLLRNIFLKKLAHLAVLNAPVTDRQRLNAIANAIIESTHIGAPQCCYFLLGLDYVISSRSTIVVNTLTSKTS